MEYILDIAKWRCGYNSNHALGEGGTLMLNKEGYSCCLGQFALQKGVEQYVLLNRGTPVGCCLDYDPNFVKMDNENLINTTLSIELMDINDSTETTPKEKIQLIKQKLAEHGLALKVVNEDLL